jgi:carboxyl-terminal processing protease
LEKKNYKILIYTLFVLFTGVAAGIFLSGKPFIRNIFHTQNNKISLILDIISSDYVDTVSVEDMTEKAIPKIMDELDPHSMYIPAAELKAIKEDMKGNYAGLGIEGSIVYDTMVIFKTIKGGPAEQAGLMSSDRIVRLDNADFTGSALSEEIATDRLRGAAGTTVVLQIKRHNIDSLIDYSIVRENIPMPTIKAYYVVTNGIGLIKIFDSFSANTYNEFINAMAQLLAQGCNKFIIDLRGNGGGVVDAAINICNEFLPSGCPIVYTEGSALQRQYVYANGLGTLQQNSIAVLVDQFSASASEIIAGAIQDNDRGIIIGRRTFGKGLIQNQIELNDGSAVRLTIARYFTPSGRSIQRRYELGKASEYTDEWLNRFSNGEEFNEDSIHQNEELLFYTKQGRKVYGGGGIMPDVFVPLDTAEMTSYYINLDSKNIFRKFAGVYSDTNRAKLGEFKDYKALLDYLKTQPVLYEITHFAEKYGIKRRTNLINISSRSILRVTYAHIIMNFFGDDTFFIVAMEGDTMIQKAIDALK